MTWQPSPVTLIDGTVVLSDAADWRHECYVRWITALPTLDQRREWLAMVEKRHGMLVLQKIQGTMHALWDAERSTIQTDSRVP